MLATVSGLDFRVYGLANNLRTVSLGNVRTSICDGRLKRLKRANSGHTPAAWRMGQIYVCSVG